MEYHAFNMIHLSDADVAGLSGGVREFLTSESDLIASGGNYGEELERASRTKNILPSLKYFFPAVPKPNEKAKPLTNDQKAQNLIFMREARKLWRKAEDELKNRVTEYVAKTMKAGGKKGSILSAQNSVADGADSERDAKGRADRDVDSRGTVLLIHIFFLWKRNALPTISVSVRYVKVNVFFFFSPQATVVNLNLPRSVWRK